MLGTYVEHLSRESISLFWSRKGGKETTNVKKAVGILNEIEEVVVQSVSSEYQEKQ